MFISGGKEKFVIVIIVREQERRRRRHEERKCELDTWHQIGCFHFLWRSARSIFLLFQLSVCFRIDLKMVLISFISLYGLILSFISILLKSTQSRKTAVGCWCMWFVNHGWCRKLARVNKKIPSWLESTGSGCRKDSRRRAEVLLKTPGHWSLQIRLPVNNIQFFSTTNTTSASPPDLKVGS